MRKHEILIATFCAFVFGAMTFMLGWYFGMQVIVTPHTSYNEIQVGNITYLKFDGINTVTNYSIDSVVLQNLIQQEDDIYVKAVESFPDHSKIPDSTCTIDTKYYKTSTK